MMVELEVESPVAYHTLHGSVFCVLFRCRDRESVSWQHSIKIEDQWAIGALNPVRDTNEGIDRRGEGTTTVTTAVSAKDEK